jgi:hypothetical protein
MILEGQIDLAMVCNLTLIFDRSELEKPQINIFIQFIIFCYSNQKYLSK